LELGGPILEGVSGWKSPAGTRGRAPGGGLGAKQEKLKKHCKLYTLGKYFVRY